MKKVLLIATGGTIASGYTKEGLVPKIAAEDLLLEKIHGDAD